ncbi:MAG: hypothetical protein MUO31_13000 [Thermodesulfovibrionales bacterium]|nr:hypothetical protein [Thermodesulfovibrionales bacterium]
MKKLTIINSILLLLFIGLGWTYTYDTDTPAGTDAPSVIDDRIREVKDAIQERLAIEHVFALTGSEVSGANTGKHSAITCTSLTSTGALSGTTITGSGNVAINTNKFTVTAATGNTLVAGTLGVTGIATVGDGSLLATSAAPTTDAMLANKKYIDDQVGTKEATLVTQATAGIFGAWTTLDTASAAFTGNSVYRAQCDGIICAYAVSAEISGLTDGSNPPTTIRQLSSATKTNLTMPVRKNDYWKITTTNTIYWLPIGTGGCVKQ